MTRALKLVPGPSIPTTPPPSPYLTLSPSARRMAHAIRASGVRIAGLGDVTTRAILERTVSEAESLAELALKWVAEVRRMEAEQ